tara:strand:+ start:286 stop:1356 length:1071 start_codon:yes stop_codon:yes gene_type:complete
VYSDDPHWVPPLKFERKGGLSSKHPFFQHAHWQPFVAYRDGRPVGRISAQVDTLFQERHDPSGAFFGCFESPPDEAVIDGLFDAAEDWARAQGCNRLLGPFNLGINQEVGVLVDGFYAPPCFLMGHGRPYYPCALQQRGYDEATRMLAYELPIVFDTPPIMASMLRYVSGRVTVRPLERKRLESELELLRDIFNDAWANNWMFVPWTSEEFQAVGREILMLVPDDFLQIVEVDGEPAAFIVMIPNLNEVIGDLNGRLLPLGWVKLLWRLKVRYPTSGRVPLMGVRRRYQGSRLGAGLAMCCIDALREPSRLAGLRRAELSWILEDNKGMRSILEAIGARVTKTYAMFDKTLGEPVV